MRAPSRKPAARPRWFWRWDTSGGAKSIFRWIKEKIAAGTFGRLVNAEANISRDRLGKIDLSSWRYTAEGMPGGVMLQIGIHYTDVLEYLIGPIKAVSGRFAQLVLPGDNPDVASLVLEHENGALSTLNASYASASEYYLMNIYGKEASAYYDLHQGLRLLKRGSGKAEAVPREKERPDRRGAGGVRRRGARRGRAPRWTASAPPGRSRCCSPASSRQEKAGASRSRRSWDEKAFVPVRTVIAFSLTWTRAPVSPARAARDYGALPGRLVRRRDRAHARRGHVAQRSASACWW